MAIRGVYSDDEKKMLAEFEKIADDLSGWDKSLRRRVATEESIRN